MTKYRIISLILIVAAVLIGYFFVFGGSSVKYGLDLSGGTQLVYDADVSNLESAEVNEAMAALRDVIERRVNAFGVSEPLVQVEQAAFGGDDGQRLIVELPGVTDIEEAVRLIGETPLLEFKLLSDESVVIPEESADEPLEIAPEYIDTGLTGRLLKGASLQFGAAQYGYSNEPIVLLEFNGEGADLFEEITGDHVGEVLAIFLDGEVLSAPVIQQEISGGVAQITGQFTPEEARTLVRDLNLGALPVPIELVSTQSVGATLGTSARDAGVMAGLIGLGIVSLFMIAWYRLSGVVAVFSLGIYLIITLAIFKLIPVVLTAAGVAGFVLSIGMAVDANILIFERMKDELMRTNDMKEAIRAGFSRAWLSIRDGNLSTIIMAVILFWAGTSLTKGFAVTLIIGVLVSMFSAITLSRTFLLAIAPEKFEGAARKLFNIGFSGITKKHTPNT